MGVRRCVQLCPQQEGLVQSLRYPLPLILAPCLRLQDSPSLSLPRPGPLDPSHSAWFQQSSMIAPRLLLRVWA